MTPDIARRAIRAAYEQGWRDACDDHMAQKRDASHPIGSNKRANDALLLDSIDPTNLLGLRGEQP